MGFFPTQDRIVRAIASLFKPPTAPVVVLDAGCGKAIHDLRSQWLTHFPDSKVTLLGIESDKSRFEQAAKLLPSTGGSALWSAIEDATVGDPMPDLSPVEACRSSATGRPFTFYPSQHEKIAGVLAGLKAKGRVWMVCDCGSGKSPMSLAAAWALLAPPPL